MHVCVMGAGIVGVTSAYELLRQGHDITLIDALPEPGAGASLGNGAQLSYSYVAPLADPSVWLQWPHYLFSRDSPLTLRPLLDPAQWSWLLHFLGACNTEQVRYTTIELLRLAYFSRDRLAQLRDEVVIDFLHRRAGKLVMVSSDASLKAAQRQVAFQKEYGSRQELLDLKQCIAIEPALEASARDWIGGVHTPDEEVGDCAMFCRKLVEEMKKQPRFRFLHSSPIGEPLVERGVLKGVRTQGRLMTADRFVLAMGIASTVFARRAGFRLPMYPLKGYSITVPLSGERDSAAPQISITDLPRKIVYARLGNRLRVAGRVELVGMDRSIPKRAVDELKRGVEELFPRCATWNDGKDILPWAGFRPATPTGLPIIGASPLKNLYLNVGHGALGWTLSFGSAALLAQQMAQEGTSIDIDAFQLHAA